ncbi:MAG: hypothetical protein QOF91_3265, partial [Alphaproteobacteria bacterium]|nr:hypothetical protein [Alphaproteobacteria bacterium]
MRAARRNFRIGALIALALAPASVAHAQTYPVKPITLVMPYPP